MRKSIFLIALLIVTSFARAVEGMWVPSLIDMFYSDMQTYGLKLSPDEIYATNKSSLKDAIVQFNGGCTAEIVSEEGLILTNHHCGFDAIQKHSSTDHNYLKDGFWAKSNNEELACPWLKVTFVKEIREVTEAVFAGIKADMSPSEKAEIINKNIKKLEEAEKTTASIQAKIKPFTNGNQYFMLITEDFNDIRLVGTPPSAIGKYGGDTDNWVWPRHTGDFSVFRIYADKDNQSAPYNEGNQPYKPAHSLPVSVKPKQVGDFTMVYGFPGSTDQNVTSTKLDFYMNSERPLRILMRQKTLDIIKPAMNADEEIGIQYASKQARIANAWKKWIGQIDGLKSLNALQKKLDFETEYNKRANSKTEWKKYSNVINDLNTLHKENSKYELARSLFIEYYFVGPEFFGFATDFFDLGLKYEELEAEGKIDETVEKLIAKTKSHFKNYNQSLDLHIFNALTPIYLEHVDAEFLPEGFTKESWVDYAKNIKEKSIIIDEKETLKLLENFSKKSAKKLAKDPAIQLAKDLYVSFLNKVNPSYFNYSNKENKLMQIYVEGMMEMFPEEKMWPDANSTMRIAYGKIDGSSPWDGMKYIHYTTIDGIMQKYDPTNPDFQLTDRFIKLYEEGDFGPYVQDDELWVCFTASNHTTGGNSGSPVIDAEGNLIGINFDRSWESTMSDFMFDESRCRNIVVDIRYVLWVIDKYGEAGHLVEEMNLITE